jgi:UDP-N-acetylglucosamine pyrophosphorylase
LYNALHHSGVLDHLIAEGKEYLFVSNSDNLGAMYVIWSLFSWHRRVEIVNF